MNIETLPISELHPDPANARRHPRRNLDAITSSLARFGQQKPVVIDANNVVRAGNGTLAAAKALGWTELRAVRTDLLGVEAAAFAIADNRAAELAEWDPDILAAALADPAIGDLGFDDEPPEPPSDEPPEAIDLAETWQVVAECDGESQQKDLFERLTKEGFACRLLTL